MPKYKLYNNIKIIHLNNVLVYNNKSFGILIICILILKWTIKLKWYKAILL